MTRQIALAVVAAASALLMLAGCEPTEPAAPARMSEARAMKIALASIPIQWESVNAQLSQPRALPQLPTIQLIRNRSTQAQEVSDCLAGAGFGDFYIAADGTVPQVSTGVAMDDWLVANFVCQTEYEYDPAEITLTRAQLRYVYDYYTTWLIPCLRLHGHGVSDLPERAVFENDGGYWNPYSSAVAPSKAAQKRIRLLLVQCPAYPAGLDISGFRANP